MKLFNMLALGLAAFAAVPMVTEAQEAPKTKMQAYIMLAKGGAARVPVARATGKDKFIFIHNDQQMQMDVGKCNMFKLITPVDHASALNAYRSGDIAEARKLLGAVKAKYAEYVGLPGNPATEAAMLELDCALRQLDWAGAKALVDGFSHPDYLSDADKSTFAVAKLMVSVSDAPGGLEKQKEAVAAVLKSEEGKKLTLADYGRLRYVLARAYEAEVPAEQLAGTVTAEQAPDLVKAVDNYCQTALSTHGAAMEIPLDAMQRALRILWALPGVKDEAAKGATMDAARWKSASVNFRDAATLAFLIRKVYTGDDAATLREKALIDEVSKYYYNAEKDKAPAAEAAQEG